MNYLIREAQVADKEAIRALFPRLAAFDVPGHRHPQDLWAGDLKLFDQWVVGKQPDCFVFVGCTEEHHILGMAMVRLQPDALSGAPSCHLEAIAVSEASQGSGLGSQLIAVCEKEAYTRGALSMTLHVFENNRKARQVYERVGFTVEIMRYRKDLMTS